MRWYNSWMNIEILSLILLLLVIIISMVKQNVNIGIVAIAFALSVTLFYPAITQKTLIAAFPSSLVLLLIGTSSFFGIAKENGTLSWLTQKAQRIIKGNKSLLPIFYFFLTAILSAIGPGNIVSTALVAPLAMASAVAYGVNPLVMAIMVCTGANAGGLSPLAPTGIIGISLQEKIGITDKMVPLKIFLIAAVLQSITAFAAYFIFKGYKVEQTKEKDINVEDVKAKPINYLTIALIVAIIVSATIFGTPLVISAFVATVLLAFISNVDLEKVVKHLPWNTIIMVSGMMILISLLENSGGMDLFTSLIAQISTVKTVNMILAFVTGVISAYSSSSGVVMPAFMPLIPKLIERIGGGNIVDMATAVSVGAHMVDVSPLSTLGALTIAALPKAEGQKALFRSLLMWGLSMSVVGAILAFVFLDVL